MLPLYVIFTLITVGFVGPCLLDIATTPQRFFDLPTKRMWLVVTIAFWAAGAAAWSLAGRAEVQARRRWDDEVHRLMASHARGPRPGHSPGAGASAGLLAAPPRRARKAAGTASSFVAPDDNPEFLIELENRIRDWREDV